MKKNIFLIIIHIVLISHVANAGSANTITGVNKIINYIETDVAGWDKYLISTTHWDQEKFSLTIKYLNNKYIDSLNNVGEEAKKLNELEKKAVFSDKWLEKISKKYGKEKIKQHRKSIFFIAKYFYEKIYEKRMIKKEKDLLYYGSMNREIQKEYFGSYLKYYTSLPADKKKNYKLHHTLIKEHFENLKLFDVGGLVYASKRIYSDVGTTYFRNNSDQFIKDVFEIMDSDEMFHKPFSMVNCIRNINKYID